MGKTVIKNEGICGKPVNVGGCLPGVAIRAEMIHPQCINGDKNNRGTFRGYFEQEGNRHMTQKTLKKIILLSNLSRVSGFPAIAFTFFHSSMILTC